MKKLITIVLALVMTLSLCACSGTYVNENGEEVSVKDGETVLNTNAELIITRIDVGADESHTRINNCHYIVTAKNNEYCIVFDVDVEQYALWSEGDTISGTLIGEYYSGYVSYSITIGDDSFHARWCGKVQ